MLPKQHVGVERTWRGLWLALAGLEALLNAERAAGDVLHLPGDVLGQADLVVGEHLQHQPQVQPPLLLGQPVPAQGVTQLQTGSGDNLGRCPGDLENRKDMGTGTYSKSVTFLSSVTGLKATTFFLSPITQAESPELANTRPGRGTQTNMATLLGAEWPSPEHQGPPSATSLAPPHHGTANPRLTLAVDLLQLL